MGTIRSVIQFVCEKHVAISKSAKSSTNRKPIKMQGILLLISSRCLPFKAFDNRTLNPKFV